jgi:Homeodomain-like domain
MLSESKRAAILELQKRGHRIRQIARTLGASRTTVHSIIESGTAQVPRPNKAEACRAQILELYFRCDGNLAQVHKELTARGAPFSYQTLTRFVRRGTVPSTPLQHGKCIESHNAHRSSLQFPRQHRTVPHYSTS